MGSWAREGWGLGDGRGDRAGMEREQEVGFGRKMYMNLKQASW